MQQGMSMAQSLRVTQQMRMILLFGESSGDIPVYSLHRIKKMLKRVPTGLGEDMEAALSRCLVRANRKYHQESGNKGWNCLTSSNLTWALEQFDDWIERQLQALAPELRDVAGGSEALEALEEQREVTIVMARDWFADNYEKLLYDMDGKVPWPVLQRLRADLRTWVIRVSNPFTANIDEMILEVARGQGIQVTRDTEPMDVWQEMGGSFFQTDDN